MKEFLNFENLEKALQEVFVNYITDDEAATYEEFIEDFAYITAESICHDMKKYCHRADTQIAGNFCDIRQDWEETSAYIGSEVEPWGSFDDVVKSIDEETISDEDLKKFQTWCQDWFFRAFGTYGLCYNFYSFICEFKYEEERHALV